MLVQRQFVNREGTLKQWSMNFEFTRRLGERKCGTMETSLAYCNADGASSKQSRVINCSESNLGKSLAKGCEKYIAVPLPAICMGWNLKSSLEL